MQLVSNHNPISFKDWNYESNEGKMLTKTKGDVLSLVMTRKRTLVSVALHCPEGKLHIIS